MSTIRAGALHNVILDLMVMIDSGKYKVSLEEIKTEMGAGRVIEFITSLGDHDAELTEGLSEDEKHLLNQHFQNCRYAFGGNERRKWGIENDGLMLMLAWAHEPLAQVGRDRQIALSN